MHKFLLLPVLWSISRLLFVSCDTCNASAVIVVNFELKHPQNLLILHMLVFHIEITTSERCLSCSYRWRVFTFCFFIKRWHPKSLFFRWSEERNDEPSSKYQSLISISWKQKIIQCRCEMTWLKYIPQFSHLLAAIRYHSHDLNYDPLKTDTLPFSGEEPRQIVSDLPEAFTKL